MNKRVIRFVTASVFTAAAVSCFSQVSKSDIGFDARRQAYVKGHIVVTAHGAATDTQIEAAVDNLLYKTPPAFPQSTARPITTDTQGRSYWNVQLPQAFAKQDVNDLLGQMRMKAISSGIQLDLDEDVVFSMSGHRDYRISREAKQKAQEKGTTLTSTVVVAVLDSGESTGDSGLWTASTFPMSNGTQCNAGVHEYDAVHNSFDPDPAGDHGTEVANIVRNEVSPASIGSLQILPVKICDDEQNITLASAVAGISFALDAKEHGSNIRLILAAWGFNSSPEPASLKDQIERAASDNVLIIASAGNGLYDDDKISHYPATLGLGNILSVASCTRQFYLSRSSNYGVSKIDLAAVGELVPTQNRAGNVQITGTSAAAAVTCGIASDLLLGPSGSGLASFSALKAAILAMAHSKHDLANFVKDGLALGPP